MKVAFVCYDGLTILDLVGAYDPITRLSTMGFMSLDWDLCGSAETATATGGMTITADRIRPDLGDYDLVFVPGGVETRELIDDRAVVDWLRTAADCDLKTSVCTGALLLGEAGLLTGKRATTHPTAFDLLEPYCEVVDERVVEDGDVITGRGVSSSIDLGLYLVETIADPETRRAIAEQMDYPYGSAVFA